MSAIPLTNIELDDSQCKVCLEKFSESKEPAVAHIKEKDSHPFHGTHRKCLIAWCNTRTPQETVTTKCLTCRENIDVRTLFPTTRLNNGINTLITGTQAIKTAALAGALIGGFLTEHPLTSGTTGAVLGAWSAAYWGNLAGLFQRHMEGHIELLARASAIEIALGTLSLSYMGGMLTNSIGLSLGRCFGPMENLITKSEIIPNLSSTVILTSTVGAVIGTAKLGTKVAALAGVTAGLATTGMGMLNKLMYG